MMKGSLVSDTSPNSTVTGSSFAALFSCALAMPSQANPQIASGRTANRIDALSRTFVIPPP
jgi:hypothetical protein